MAHTNQYASGEYLEKYPDWGRNASTWKADKVHDMLTRHNLNPATICDVGCGAGMVLNHLQKYYKDSKLTGFDISPQAIGIAKKFENKNLNYLNEDFLATSTENFEIILLLDVLEHVEDHIGFLRKLRGRADKYIFHLPLELSALSIARNKLGEYRRQRGHIHQFTRDKLLDILEYTNYRIIDHFYTGAAIDVPGLPMNQRLFSYPRRIAFFLNAELGVRLLGGYSIMILAE